ncbi:MAG: GTP 3',8-cyclase MoaA [Candidatus Bathyarchaeota archaeon]|nr:GTP 3',8-cyclase MoaA [Candidatus Bathyarchaeota archaeon]
MIYDNYGRPVLNLRISVTQKCNMHCPYCHREGETNPSTVMSVEEIVHIVKIALSLGISRVKLTGGEPLLRKDILDIVEGIAELRGLRDLSITTNGTFLEAMAKDLKMKGLNRVNVSLPTLNPETYRNLRGGNLRDAIEGVRAAVEAELYPVKLNMLILKNVNEREVERMIQFAERTMTILQLIELEPLNLSDAYYERYHLDLNEIEQRLKEQALEVRTREYMQNRRIYFLPKVKVEVIHPIENTEFCARCTRIRVTSDGKLKPCLMRNDNLVDILTPLRNGADEEELTKIFLEAVKRREPYYKALTEECGRAF